MLLQAGTPENLQEEKIEQGCQNFKKSQMNQKLKEERNNTTGGGKVIHSMKNNKSGDRL